MDRILQFLSEYAGSIGYDKLPQEVVHDAKRRVIDAVGCALGAYREKTPGIARSLGLEVVSKPGATIWGTRHRTTPELAAFANGVMTRYLDFNDTGRGVEGHPSGNIPAVLTAAEYAGADGRTAITGIVLAYEVQGRLAQVCDLWDRGWDHPIYMALGSTTGASKVMGLTREQIANAIAITATSNFSLRQTRVGGLSNWKGCAEGNASRNGVFAAIMAGRGMTGPQEVFEGKFGFLNINGPMQLPAFGGKGQSFRILEAKHKFFPSDHETQCAAQPAVELHELLGGRVEDIEKVIVHAYAIAVTVGADSPDKWAPTTRETADHSLPYVLAVALTKGNYWFDDFSEEHLKDPGLCALMQKIEVRESKEYTQAFPDANCFRIELTTRSGARHVREVRFAKGDPKNPMTDGEIEAKFRHLTEPVMSPGRMEKALDCLWHLDEMRDLRRLVDLFEAWATRSG